MNHVSEAHRETAANKLIDVLREQGVEPGQAIVGSEGKSYAFTPGLLVAAPSRGHAPASRLPSDVCLAVHGRRETDRILAAH